MRAYCLIRSDPWYRRQAFEDGLKRAGFDVSGARPGAGRPGEVLVIWNRYWDRDQLASAFERDGGRVLVAENGYLGHKGVAPKFDVHPKGPKPGSYYALGQGYHNDDGRVVVGGGERFAALEVELKPWRTEGKHILVAPNRPFGPPGRAMPADWAARTEAKLRSLTRREIRVRQHPGNEAPRVPVERDLEGAWAVVIWSSSVGIKALVAGIPVVCEAPHWIGKACAFGLVPSEWEAMEAAQPEYLDHNRRRALERMAWGQWTVEEIASGEPFRRLLNEGGGNTWS